MMTTPKAITYIVICSLAAMAVSYMATLCCCVFWNINPSETIGRQFESVGNIVLGMLGGALINTRSHREEIPPTTPTTTNNINAPSDSTTINTSTPSHE
jgi:hypothetical protein